MHGISDTSPDAERVMIDCYRRMPAWRKIKLVTDAYLFARQLHQSGHRQRNPNCTIADINREWVMMTLGKGPWLDRMEFATMKQPPEHIQTVKYVISVLDDLNIRYAIGGSYASSFHGYSRHTNDADITVEPFPQKETLFALRFPKDEYYADEQMIRDAVSRRSTFNIIHLLTAFKIDVFVQHDRPFEKELMARRVKARIFDDSEMIFGVVTAEDSILLKLEWYRMGGEISDRQWTDIMGVMRTQGSHLDDDYLNRWAANLNLTDLLTRARSEV